MIILPCGENDIQGGLSGESTWAPRLAHYPHPLWSDTDSPSLFAQAVGRDGNAETHNECEEHYSL